MKSPRTFGAFGKQRESKTSLRRTNFQWMQPFYEPVESVLGHSVYFKCWRRETALHRA